ncbi:MAG: methyltransferase domain-containing protein [Xanthomonadales bacterium]|nr:methyltransferase domain-containing protein [Xanthomonadales bacterium]
MKLHNKPTPPAGDKMPRNESVRESYDRHSQHYDQYAALEKEVCSRLLDRITFRRTEPATVLDLGCGTGGGAAALKKAFRKAQVVAIDLSAGMLSEAARQSRLRHPLKRVNADIGSLPFSHHTADLIFSSLAAPWLTDPRPFFEEVRRVLKPGGMFLFSMFGPASLSQLRLAAMQGLGEDLATAFPDVLEAGDWLTAAGFREPVMDVDLLTLHYPDLDAMSLEIETTGSALLVDNWPQIKSNLGLLGGCWETIDGGRPYPLAFEVLYGVAFGAPEGQPRRTADGEIAAISVDSLLKSRNLSYD